MVTHKKKEDKKISIKNNKKSEVQLKKLKKNKQEHKKD